MPVSRPGSGRRDAKAAPGRTGESGDGSLPAAQPAASGRGFPGWCIAGGGLSDSGAFLPGL